MTVKPRERERERERERGNWRIPLSTTKAYCYKDENLVSVIIYVLGKFSRGKEARRRGGKLRL